MNKTQVLASDELMTALAEAGVSTEEFEAISVTVELAAVEVIEGIQCFLSAAA